MKIVVRNQMSALNFLFYSKVLTCISLRKKELSLSNIVTKYTLSRKWNMLMLINIQKYYLGACRNIISMEKSDMKLMMMRDLYHLIYFLSVFNTFCAVS